MNDIYTKDKVKIFKGMIAWLSPSYYMGEYIDGFKTHQEKYIVFEIIDENEIKIRKHGEIKITYSYQANLIFANKKKAIKDRILKLSQIIEERKSILLGTIKREREEMDKIQRFQDELIMKL